MTEEEQVKFACKWIIENSSRGLTDLEKDLLKKAIDSSRSWGELVTVAVMSRMMQK